MRLTFWSFLNGIRILFQKVLRRSKSSSSSSASLTGIPSPSSSERRLQENLSMESKCGPRGTRIRSIHNLTRGSNPSLQRYRTFSRFGALLEALRALRLRAILAMLSRPFSGEHIGSGSDNLCRSDRSLIWASTPVVHASPITLSTGLGAELDVPKEYFDERTIMLDDLSGGAKF